MSRLASAADTLAALDEMGVILWARRDPRTERALGWYWARKDPVDHAYSYVGKGVAPGSIHGPFPSAPVAGADAIGRLGIAGAATGYADAILGDEITELRWLPIGEPMPPGWCLAEDTSRPSVHNHYSVLIRQGGIA